MSIKEKFSRMLEYRSRTVGIGTGLWLTAAVFVSPAASQQIGLSVGSGTAAKGGTVTLGLSLTNSGGTMPSSLQWTMTYPGADVATVNFAIDSAGTSAGKGLACNPNTAGSTTCVLYSASDYPLTTGSVANATIQVSSTTQKTSIPMTLTSVASSADGASVAVTATGGNVSVNSSTALSGLTCTPSSVSGPGTASCSVTLSGAAPASGFGVQLASNNANAIVPQSVMVSSGNTSAAFTATVGSVSAPQTATLTGQAGGTSKTCSLNLLAPQQPSAEVSVWGPATVPTNVSWSDPNAVELGMKFQSDVTGTVTGVRFYKGSRNTGAHVGHLWAANGTLLGSVNFTNESASGWQQANFSSPVSIQANTTYVISYFAPAGYYPVNTAFFNSAINSSPLHALQSSTSGGNGTYRYGASGFPNQSYNGNNYWVDVVFVPSGTTTGGTN